jgi:hypothetical protein
MLIKASINVINESCFNFLAETWYNSWKSYQTASINDVKNSKASSICDGNRLCEILRLLIKSKTVLNIVTTLKYGILSIAYNWSISSYSICIIF